MSGPLEGLKAVVFGGIGPGPFCAMLLADLGADVVRIDPPTRRNPLSVSDRRFDVLSRGQTAIVLDLKSDEGREAAFDLVRAADLLVEGYRPGAMEALKLGPEECHRANPGLVYGRITGWGQTGPRAQTAGHDINYIAVSGALDAMRWAGAPPTPPLNLLGDYAGGGLMLAFGLLAALYERSRSGKGQVVDTAMTEGSALLLSQYYGWKAAGLLDGPAGTNLVDGALHFYGVYACADGKHLAVGAMEPQFYAELRSICGLDPQSPAAQYNPGNWDAGRAELADLFRQRTRDEWIRRFAGTDACVSPVLDYDEAPEDEHNVARGAFVERDGVKQPSPTPRFSRTRAELPAEGEVGADTRRVLAEWGLEDEIVARLMRKTQSWTG